VHGFISWTLLKMQFSHQPGECPDNKRCT